MNKTARQGALICAVAAMATLSYGADYTWNGRANDGNWANTANWAGGIAPTTLTSAGDTLIFDGAHMPAANLVPYSGTLSGGSPMIFKCGGTFTLDMSSSFNSAWISTEAQTAFTIGDGVGNAASVTLDIINADSVHRHDNTSQDFLVNSDGVLKINTLIPYGDNLKPFTFTLNGGSLISAGAAKSWDTSANLTDTYVQFNKAGSSFTAAYGGVYGTFAAVQADASNHLRAGAGIKLHYADHGSSFTVTAVYTPIQPVITVSTDTGYAALEVVFDGSGSTADHGIASYAWDFGDGHSASGVLVTNTYTAGNFTATLTVTDRRKNRERSTVTIQAWDDTVYAASTLNYVSLSGSESLAFPIKTQILKENLTSTTSDVVVVDLNSVVHPNLSGIGGAFNEQGGEAFMSLPQADRKKVAEALFNPKTGAGLTLCRTAIGASDFGLGAYSYSETADDFKMKKFSVERDTTSVIPFILAAKAANPELRIFASPWSPPGWMKKSGKMDGGGPDSVLKKDPGIYKAYALYFSKYAQAYAKHGVPIERIIIQNETDMNPSYPGCDMLPGQMAELVSGYVHPQFKKDRLKTEIWAGTFRGINGSEYRKDALVFMTLDGHQDVDGLGMQYCAPNILRELHKTYPKMPMMHTEGACHNGLNSMEQARGRFKEISGWLYNGTENYCYWNMVLNEKGKSGWGWKQNSLMKIDRQAGVVTYNADFAPLALLGRYIRPGDQLLQVSAPSGITALAVRNSERMVLFLQNDLTASISKKIQIYGQTYAVDLPAQSLCAVVFK